MAKTTKQKLGKSGENLAQRILQSKGYKILTSNFYTKFGEIDLVAVDGDTLVFVEVKSRKDTKKGFPEEAVNRRKIGNIKLASHIYNNTHPNNYQKFRIDIVSIITNSHKYKIIKGVDI